MGFDVVAFINGIWQSQYGLLVLLSGLGLLAPVGLGLLQPPVPDHRRDDVQQLAARAAGRHRHRPVARLRLHHLRRPAQFHLRAAAFHPDRLRHPGRDADRGVADRRELRHRHEPAQRFGQRPHRARSHRRHAARRGAGRPGVLLAAQSIQRRRFHAGLRAGRRLGPVRRRRALFPDCRRAGRRHRLQLPARRRHLHAVRAERAPDRQERGVVGDVPGLDGRPRCSFPSTRTSTPSSRPSRESGPPRSAR